MKTYIYTLDRVARSNRNNHALAAPIAVRFGNAKPLMAYRVSIDGPSDVVYRPLAHTGHLSKMWVETDSPVRIEEVAANVNFLSRRRAQ